MTDRQLLEDAAKAAGIEGIYGHAIGCENNPVDIALRARGTHEA